MKRQKSESSSTDATRRGIARRHHRHQFHGPPARLEWPAPMKPLSQQSQSQSQQLSQSSAASSQSSATAARGRRSWVGSGNDAPRRSSSSEAKKRLRKTGGGGGRQRTLDAYTGKKSSGGSRKSAATRSDTGGREEGQRDGGVSSSSSSMLWVDKHTPTTSSDLCVAPKKVKEVRGWIEAALESGGGGRSHVAAPRSSKLLLLVGSPGIGKSTMCRVLASELGLSVLEWNDSHSSSSPRQSVGGDGSLSSVPYQSQLSSFEEFLQRGGGFRSLELSMSPPVSAAAAGDDAGMDGVSRSRKRGRGSLLLIEEVPNLHDRAAEQRFRSIMTQHIHRTTYPTVLIFSDVSEGKAAPSDLERLVDPAVLHSHHHVRILQCNAVTQARVKKCLRSIATTEEIDVSPEELEELSSSCGGDVRGAIMSLQFRFGAPAESGPGDSRRCGKRRRLEDGGAGGGMRDTRLSAFHALGKILYAKRVDAEGTGGGRKTSLPFGSSSSDRSEGGDGASWRSRDWIDRRAPLLFDPEGVLNENDMGPDGALAFLSYHCPEFFTDSIELSRAVDRFSDAALMSGRLYDTQRDRSDTIYPMQYVCSLGGRAVADANKHPAPGKFRSFCAPKIFDVMRKRNENKSRLVDLGKRLSHCDHRLRLEDTQRLVTESLPFMKTILPHEMNYTLGQLHSVGKEVDESTPHFEVSPKFLEEAMEEQQCVLAMDDIVEDDESDGDVSTSKRGASGVLVNEREIIVVD